MGGDYQYSNAHKNFKNLDKLVKYINQRVSDNLWKIKRLYIPGNSRIMFHRIKTQNAYESGRICWTFVDAFHLSIAAAEWKQSEHLLFHTFLLRIRLKYSWTNLHDQIRRFLSLCTQRSFILDWILHKPSSLQALRPTEQCPVSGTALLK